MTHGYEYPMNMGAATMLIIRPRFREPISSMILLALRGDKPTFGNMWSIPGGMLNAGTETGQECAARETKEETGLDFKPEDFKLFKESSRVETDPRGHVINLCYWVESSKLTEPKADDDLADVKWITMLDFMNSFRHENEMAFNHKEITVEGIEKWLKEQQ